MSHFAYFSRQATARRQGKTDINEPPSSRQAGTNYSHIRSGQVGITTKLTEYDRRELLPTYQDKTIVGLDKEDKPRPIPGKDKL